MNFFLIVYTISSVSGVYSGNDYCKRKYHSCVHEYCCCSSIKAVCDGNYRDKLTYIPLLPKGIKSLKLSNNNLNTLDKPLFKNVTTLILEEIIIDEDDVVNVTQDAFESLKHLKIVRFKGNKDLNKLQLFTAIERINKHKLKVLDLTDIGISGDVPTPLLNIFIGSLLKTIILDGNSITSIDIGDFINVTRLEFLRLSPNKITQFNASQGHLTLQSLVLTHNEIAGYPPQFCRSKRNPFPKLQYLYLDNNFISVISPDNFECLTNLRRLVLNANVLRKIPDNIIANVNFLVDFRIGQMPSLQRRDIAIDKYAFNSSSLKRLDLDANNMIFTRKHVDNNFFESCKQLTYLDIRKNNMIQISDEDIAQLFSPLAKLKKLYLDANHLRSIPTNMLRNFTDLKFLSVDGNGIQDFGSSLLGPVSLRYLSANGNNIRVIKPETLPLKVRKTLRRLNLSQNPLACTCENLWFRNWIGDDGKPRGSNIALVNWPHRYRCYTPSEWNNKEFKTYRPTEASCQRVTLIITISASLASLSVIILIVVLASVRYRWHLMYFWYRIKQITRNRNPEKARLLPAEHREPYIYVIYHDDDRQFVHKELLSLVEEQFGLKIFIWHRDAGLGTKADVMFNAIDSSENVLAIVSKHFVKDGWCEFQLELGLSKKNSRRNDCLTLLILENLDISVLRRSWCVTLVKNATINWSADTQTVQGRLCYDRLKVRLSSS